MVLKSWINWVGLCALALVGCETGLYNLPSPPPRSEWVDLTQGAEEDPEADVKRFLAAKRTIIQLYSMLSDQDIDAAWELLSFETQNFLDYVSAERGGKEALRSGMLSLPGGDNYEIGPVSLLLLENVDQIVDDHSELPQTESARRKELFLVDELGRAKRVIVIQEAGEWKLHKTRFDPTSDRARQ